MIDSREQVIARIVSGEDMIDAEYGRKKTLRLMHLELYAGHDLHFIIEDSAEFDDESDADFQREQKYLYQDHLCPKAALLWEPRELAAIVLDGDFDHHGIFSHVRTAWMTTGYLDESSRKEYLVATFPEIRAKIATKSADSATP